MKYCNKLTWISSSFHLSYFESIGFKLTTSGRQPIISKENYNNKINFWNLMMIGMRGNITCCTVNLSFICVEAVSWYRLVAVGANKAFRMELTAKGIHTFLKNKFNYECLGDNLNITSMLQYCMENFNFFFLYICNQWNM